MSEPSDQTRRWSVPPSSLSYPRGEWRNVSGGSGGRGGSAVPLWVQRAGYLFLTLCLVAVIGWLIFLLFDRPDRTKIVAIGMSTYSEPAIPPNPFGLQDTNRFLDLAESQDVSIWRDKLTGNAINQIPNEISLDGYQNLVVFVNLHAVVLMDQEGGKLQLHFLAVDAAPNSFSAGTGTALVSVKSFLKKFLQKSPVENILLLADTGRTGVNWRLGLFDNTASDQLKEEVKELTAELKKEFPEKSLPNLHVICSTGSHEVSWMWPEKKQSVFAYYVIEGLKGEADGEGGQLKDERVSCKELFDYVKKRVQNWTRTNRNAIQTVQRFGAGNDFDIFPVRTKQNARAVEEKEKSQSVSDSSGGEKSQGSGKNAKASNSDDQKKTNTKENDKNSKPATPQDNAKHLLKRLATFWKHRDALRKEGHVALHSPHVWRALQSNLVRAEKLLRDGGSSEALSSEATKRLDAAENYFNIIGDRTGDYRKNSNEYSTLRQTSVAFQLLVKQNEADEQQQPESTDQKAEQPDISKLVGDVLESTLEKSDEASKPLVELLKANTSAEGEIARQTIEQTWHCLNTSDRQKLGAVRRLLTLLRKNGREHASRDNQGPAELLLIDQLTAPEFLGDNPSDEVLQLSARAIALRQKLEKLIAENPDEVSRLQPGLDRALRSVTTGERWLLEAGAVQARDSDHSKAGESFETAEKLVHALQDDVKSLRTIVLLRAELLAELPDYARWSADRLEGTSSELPGRQSGSLSSLAQVQSQVEFSDVFAGKLLKLMADLRRLESQLANAMTELRNNEPIPIALTRLSDQVRTSWETLQSDFQEEVQELLDEESVTSSTWPLIDSILQVPWIDAENRSLLQEKLKRELASSNAEPKPDSRLVPGGWQAFWAIQTLALSGKNVDGLWGHWNELISDSTSSEQSQRKNQAILGQEINKLYTEIRQDAYSTQRSNSSKPHARELLVRLADGWDYPQNFRDDPLVAIRKNRFRELMELRRNDWFLHRNRFHSLAQKYAEICQSLGSQPAGGESMPSVELLTQRLSFPSGASDDLTLRIDNFTNQSEVNSTQPRWKLLFLSSHAKIFAEGEAASELTADDIKQGGERAYRVELLPEEERQSKLTIALVRIEGKEEFPVSIKHVTLIPPSDSSKWKIEFLASDEKQRMDRRNRSSSTSDDRNGQENSTTFGLPPLVGEAPKHYELIPYLTFPGGLSGGTVNVQAYLRSDQKRTVIAEANDVLLQTGENRVPLIFQKSRGEDPKGNSPLPISPTDISDGLVFEILQEGKTPIRHTVFPDIWPARQFIAEPILQTSRTRFSISLKRSDLEKSDPLFPSKTPLSATLYLPETLKNLSPKYVQTIGISASESSDITVSFEANDLAKIKRGESFPILLSVSGWPYAFRWKMEYNGFSFSESKERDEVRIAVVDQKSPEAEETIRLDGNYLLGKAQPVRFLLLPDSKILDQSEDRVPWKVKWEIGVNNQNFPIGNSTLFSSHDEKIGLKNIEAGRWQFIPEVNNHIFEYDLKNSGRFRIRARVFQENRELDPAFFSVVVDDTPPRKSDIQVKVFEKIFTLSEPPKPLKIGVIAIDRESGISKIEAGIDLNDDGKLDDTEIVAKQTKEDPVAHTKWEGEIQIPTGKLPRDKQKRYRILVRATNGIGRLSEPAESVRITFKLPTGSVIVKVVGKPFNRELIWILKKPNGSEIEVKKKSRVNQITIQDLPPGKYTVILKDTKRKVRGKSGEFQVAPGEKNKVLPPIKFR